jgi:hypothetical protein
MQKGRSFVETQHAEVRECVHAQYLHGPDCLFLVAAVR